MSKRTVKDDKFELYIIKALLSYDDYAFRFVDHIDKEQFIVDHQPIIDGIMRYWVKKGSMPTPDMLCDRVLPKLIKDNKIIRRCETIVEDALALKIAEKDFEDFCEDTKYFIRRQTFADVMMKAVELTQNKEDDSGINEALDMIMKVAEMNFDSDLGLDYWADLEERMERLKVKEDVISTGIPSLDNVIKGGWHRKSLNIIGGETNIGKTLILTALSHHLMVLGYNVLYITLEINDDLLANRLDANIGDVDIGEINESITPEHLLNILKEKQEANKNNETPYGKFIIKDYQSRDIKSNEIKGLLHELASKRGFKPDAIVVDSVDYVIPNGKAFSDNTYGRLKTAARELRNVMCEFNVAGFSATQVNRESFGSSEVELKGTSDSIGVPQTADLMIMVSQTPEMADANKFWFNIGKNRYGKKNVGFHVNVDYPKMRISDDSGPAEVEKKHKKVLDKLRENNERATKKFKKNTDKIDSNDKEKSDAKAKPKKTIHI